ncbi:MAG: hypothetical protein A2285_05805 [Elusimicrobia bacterium RIFOXYA12_FULL_57_11]|nr:MAG: hypothetical protein A2285_05805 [Elusimicrobia bacterium RIFOXYA12_FULL_57_11]
MAGGKTHNGISEAVTWRKTGEEAVILNLETSEYYSANDTGTFIWELLSAGKQRAKVAEALAAEYGITEEQAALDTETFIEDLARLKILTQEIK